MKIIVAGSRTFNNYELLKSSLDKIIGEEKDITIVSGTARGADTLGEQYAKEKGFMIDRYPAEWDKYGKSAGYIRNKTMAQNADACVLFWDGLSKGTKHMHDLSLEHELKTFLIKY